MAFFIGARLFSKRIGYYTAFFIAINGLLLEMVSGRAPTDHVDVFFAFFIEASVVCAVLLAEKKKTLWAILSGASIGLAILCKWLPALIVFPIVIMLLSYYKFTLKEIIGKVLIMLGALLVVAAPWQIYIFTVFPEEAAWE